MDQDGKSLYLNKEKVQNLITQQRTNLADVSYLDLNSIDNIVVDNGKIVYAKKLPDGTVLYIEEVRRGRKELAFVSMRKMKGNIPNDLMEKMLSPENLNAWNDSAILPSDGNIPQNPDNQNHQLSWWYALCLKGINTGSPTRALNKIYISIKFTGYC